MKKLPNTQIKDNILEELCEEFDKKVIDLLSYTLEKEVWELLASILSTQCVDSLKGRLFLNYWGRK